jgi:hypothetical protein
LHFIRATLATLYVPPLYVLEIRHALLLTFTNGEIRHFDMTPYPGYPAFEPLRQVALFKLARASHGTVTWRKRN